MNEDLRNFQTVGLNTLKYVTKRLRRTDNTLAYAEAFLGILEMSDAEFDLAGLYSRLLAERIYWKDLAKVKETVFSENRKYTLLAYAHALDIVDSIRARFHGTEVRCDF